MCPSGQGNEFCPSLCTNVESRIKSHSSSRLYYKTTKRKEQID